ncbi:carboxylesterase/lipase family protein [Adhaeribacter radiodurans]|uniref:Carboxylic ester hydrolase n=1 Tax=Adhaeribacter radiodurans TaxID=2745197 RepID=A0A7L7L402_9BACT|nr:carboxylesterase family protein [Adhaeribacter radiodurans]QMU27510.1 carboxylesterase family protein [Adhaeribacter radiodurans]
MFVTVQIVIYFLLNFLFAPVNPKPLALGVVKTQAGLVSGIKNQAGDVAIYRGIPFAAPPIKDLRWKAPQPVKPWSGVKRCEVFGPSPMQADPAPFSMWSAEFLIPKEPISEDCLYLNVWSGVKSAAEKRPVLVWIYGGGFNSGGSAVPIYDGEALAQKGIVFVSINYRVGIFGFFAHPDLSKESGKNASGNYGLLDQIAALQWVQKNIAAFGGDPKNVTIAGQSAGSMSVNCLVASPLAKNLFVKAIAQSGANFSRGTTTLQQAEQDGVKLAQTVNVTSLADLRAKPAKELMQQTQARRGPIIDGYVLPMPIAEIFAAGQENKVALLTGWNEDEGLVFGPLKTAEEFRKQAEQQYGAEAKTFLEHYPAGDEAQAINSQYRLSRDMIFGVQNYTWANVQSQQEKQKVFVYRFTRKVPATGEYVKYGAFHTGEVPYAYNNLKFVDRPWQPVDQQLASSMSAYWANFIKNGNPNGAGLPEWPAYNPKNNQIMILDEKLTSRPLPDKSALDFIATKMESK